MLCRNGVVPSGPTSLTDCVNVPIPAVHLLNKHSFSAVIGTCGTRINPITPIKMKLPDVSCLTSSQSNDACKSGKMRVGCIDIVPCIVGAQTKNRQRNRYRLGETAADCASAARTVFRISIAIVIGPTPPGFGVIHDATCRTSSKSTSPTNL